ncbi:hypothetical protein WCQ02_37525 [Paraburkholderia tropica]|uniref:hypothetical protein n=1 Tax=Paraburkholderia tropica TaxID=92647 RepID=UPI003017A1AE
MSNATAQHQIELLLDILGKSMEILRDDRRFDASEPEFGKLYSTDKESRETGGVYIYRNSDFEDATMKFYTTADPLNYSDDRQGVAVVPERFEFIFTSARRMLDIEPSLIKQRLDLSDYRIDFDGSLTYGNDLGAGLPQYPLLHTYRYRANERADSRFPVDVDLDYGDADPADPTDTRILMRITISRYYPYLTPEMRKQKREEERLKKREQYGYMNLCTGGVCPETGYWEGWTKESGPTDILRVEKGQKFDAVRTVPLTTDRSSCPMVPGQWMWLCSLEEARGFQWKGFTLNG